MLHWIGNPVVSFMISSFPLCGRCDIEVVTGTIIPRWLSHGVCARICGIAALACARVRILAVICLCSAIAALRSIGPIIVETARRPLDAFLGIGANLLFVP